MEEKLWTAFIISLPLFFEILLILGKKKPELIKLCLKDLIEVGNICPHSRLANECNIYGNRIDNNINLRRLSGRIEEFNINCFVILNLFINALLNPNMSVKNDLMLLSAFGLVIILTQRYSICANYQKYKWKLAREKPLLLYAFGMWIAIILMNIIITFVNDHYV
jgi:hypothetical protein